MIKAITLLKRKAGMAVEDFQAYWLNRHPEPVLKLPGVKRYVQSHALAGAYRKGEPAYDGIAEVWFADMAALCAQAKTPEYAAVMADEERFIDRASMALLLVQEHIIKDGAIPDNAVKNVEFIHRKAGMDIEAYQRYWREVHGPIAARIPMMPRYIQNHPRLGAYRDGRQPACDGLAITWFASTDDMRASARCPEYAETRGDEPNFIDGGRLSFLICKEHVIFGGTAAAA